MILIGLVVDMSLPSQARFYMNDGTEVLRFCNIGWYFEESHIPRCVREAATGWETTEALDDTEWHSVKLYDRVYTKPDLNRIMRENIERRSNLKR